MSPTAQDFIHQKPDAAADCFIYTLIEPSWWCDEYLIQQRS